MEKISVYDRLESNFTHNGIVLPDVVSCIVEEELNGKYLLELTHPIDKKGKWENLIEENIIKADGQLFRIHSTEKNLQYVYVYARHIFYDLLHNFIEDARPTQMNGSGALNWILNNTQYPHNFVGMSDIDTLNTQYYIRKNPIECILGSDSLVTRWSGELERDNYTIKLLSSIGQNKGSQIAYGKNLMGLEVERNMDSVATRIMPIGRDGLLIPEKYIDSPLINNYSFPYIKKIEFDIGIDDDTTETQAYDKLRQAANDLYEIGKVDIPYININANLLLLENTEEYKHLKNLVKVNLGDVVSCTDNPINIQFESKVIRVKKDILSNKNVEVELGQFKKGISNTMQNAIKDISEELKNSTSDLELAIENATELLTNALGGYVLKRPGELLIMDTDDVNTATKIWRWNLNGLGYSKSGINGPYGLAMTMDGAINANFITTGLLSANLVKTGMIISQDASTWINLDNGDFNLKNSMSYVNGNFKIHGGILEGEEYGGVSINAEDGIRVNFTEGGDATIGKDSIIVNNIDGSKTKIDGRGVSRVLSIPIFEDVASGTDMIDDFNSGNISDSRININDSTRSEAVYRGGWLRQSDDMVNHISIVSNDYYSSPYSAKIQNIIPQGYMDQESVYEGEGGPPYYMPIYSMTTKLWYGSRMSYWLENYTPTKNTTFSMRYKYVDSEYGSAYINIYDIIEPSNDVTLQLNSTTWNTVNHPLLKNHVYRFAITLKLYKTLTFIRDSSPEDRNLEDYRPTTTNALYIDDILYEDNLNDRMIVGYRDGESVYNPFFHVDVATKTTMTLPTYFTGMDYQVFPLGNGVVEGVNNTIPNVTFNGTGFTFITIVQ